MKKKCKWCILILCISISLTSVPAVAYTVQTSKKVFTIEKIPAKIWKKINGNSYKKNDILKPSDLRYLTISYYGFDGKVHRGEMIVNKKIAKKTIAVFKELYKKKYPIEKMVLIDEYDADDEDSMKDNNTCAFNYRTIAGTSKLSNHGLGLAIDINPLYNPYVKVKNGKTIVSPKEGKKYADRGIDCEYMIQKKDICVKIFEKYGFSWGGSWKSVKDYQHFEYTGK